jgi:hypothetical protein
MKSQSTISPLKSIIRLIHRYNFVIFIVIVSVGLMASILFLNDILNRPYTNGTSSGNTTTIFDVPTINRLNKLESSASNTSYKTVSPGRQSPFTE